MSLQMPPASDRLALLYRLTQTFNSSLELDEVLNRVIDEVIAVMRAERGFVMLSEGGQLIFHVARGIDRQTIEDPQFQISRGVIETVARTGQPVHTSDAQTDSRFSGRQSVMLKGLRSILCVPLTLKGRLLGIIYVDSRSQTGIFTPADLDLLNAIAANAAVAVENARLYQDVQQKLATLRLLHAIGVDLSATLDLERVLTASLQRVQELLGVAAASILTIEGDELVFQAAIGDKADQIRPFRIPKSQGVAGWVVEHAQGVIVNDTRSDPRFYEAVDQSSGFVTQGIMAAPLTVNERTIGVLEVFNKQQGDFTPADLDLLVTIASSAAIAIENARLYRVAVEKGRMDREMEMARRMQISLLPEGVPSLPGWEFAACWLPAREVAGDYYDFILHENGTLGLVIADVTDKGMPAALFMAFSRSIVRASLDAQHSPAAGLTRANHLICADSSNGFFVTLCYARLAPASGEIVFVNAGHNPPLLCQHAPAITLSRLGRTGIPLGVDETSGYSQQSLHLEPGDFIVFYTDGVTDALDANEHDFGMERLQEVILAHCHASAAELVAALEQALADFAASTERFDDITIVVARRTPVPLSLGQ